MKVLVANLGSTSFKYQLFEGSSEALVPLSKGGYERVTDYAASIQDALHTLVAEGHLSSVDAIDAVGFKTVLGHDLTGCVRADASVVADLRKAAVLAPAHNPPYARGIEQFSKILPNATLVALFETAFYQWTAPEARRYAVPASWHEAGVRRNGFHGASHKFIAEASARWMKRPDVEERVRNLYHRNPMDTEVVDPPLRVISCHLGGSSSVTAICNGLAVDTSMGLSPQSGMPQNNRVGDLDAMAVPYVMKTLNLELEEIELQLTKESGLLGLSGVSNDVRDIRAAAAKGNANAALALAALTASIKHSIGAYAFRMGGVDALVFTAGIGENDAVLRSDVCAGLEGFGIELDEQLNSSPELGLRCISRDRSRTKVLVIPANEEEVVASETCRFVENLGGFSHSARNANC